MVAAILVVAATLVTVGIGEPVSASDGYITFPDVHGVDDAGAQADLTLTAVDYGHLEDLDPKLYARWNWDETSYPGNNTGDACALFDTTGDGLANYAVCVSIGGNPASQQVDSPRLYECTASNLSNSRCNGDTELVGVTTTCSVAIVGTDTQASCEIDMDDVGGGDATLINTCSYNSSEPNSNPPDCVLQPGMGITVVKDVADDAAIDSVFDVVIAGVGTVSRTVTGDGSFFVPAGNGAHSVTEVSTGNGYQLDSSSCTAGTPSAVNLAFGGTESSTCTFVNQVGVASSTTVKTFSPASVAAGTGGHNVTIAVTNDGTTELTGVQITDIVDPALQVTGVGSDLGGDCSASSGNTIDCTVASIPAGQTATVTVTYSVASTVEPTTVTNTATVTSAQLPTPQTATDSLTITEDVDLVVAKAFTSTPSAGTTGNSFTIVVTNNGASDAEAVSITDTVDAELAVTGVAIAPVGDCSASSGQLIDCTVADLGAGQSVVVTVVYDVDESQAPTTVINTATVTSDEVGPITDTATVSVVEDVDLLTVKTFGSDPVPAGAVGRSFVLAVTNAGSSDAENLTIADIVNPALVVDSVTSDLGDCSASSGQTVDCSLTTLASGQTVTVTVGYHVDSSTEPATVSNTATAASDEDAASATTTVDITEDVVLDLVKSFDTATAVAGSTGNSFSVELTNTGLSDAENIVVTDTVDSRLTVAAVSSPSLDCSASSGQTVSCSGATLAAGATVTITVTYDVASTTDPATVTNTATAGSDEDSTTASDSVDITEDVALTATKSFSPATAAAGGTGNTFAITVTNSGASDADNVTVTDTVDATLEVTGVSTTLGDCSASSGQNIDCSIPSLDGGLSATITVTYQIDSGATIAPVANTASVASDEDTASASASVDVVADVGFLVTKDFAADTIEAGSNGNTFTISVTNSGPSDATAVTITDTVDPTLVVTTVSSVTADCSASSGQVIDCSLPVLTAGTTTTVTVGYDVAPSVEAATVSNTVTVDSNESSPTTATDTVDVVEDVVLSATKTFAAATVAAGSTGNTFAITVTNTGSSDADNIVLTDTVAAGLQVTSVSSASASCATDSLPIFSCTASSLGGGDSLTIVVTYDVDQSAPAATVSNTATVTSDEDTTSATDTIDIVEDVVLELNKVFDDATVSAGVAGRTFSLTASNTGISDAENISLTDTVAAPLVVTAIDADAGLDCSASSGNTIDCSGATLDPGDSVTVTVTYDVVESAEPVTVTNTATLTSDEDSVATSDSIDVVEDVDLTTAKAFGSATNTAGGSGYSFTILVSNGGLSDAENLSIVDVVDPALTVTGVSISSGDCSASSGNTIDCSIPTLDGGASSTVTVTYDVDADVATSTIANTVTVTSDEDTALAGDTVDITESVTLSALKSFTDNQVVAGESSSFDIRVTNSGLSTADNVAITDTVDSAIDLTGVTTTLGDCSASTASAVDCIVTSLAPGQSVTVTATFDITADTDPTTITNTASVASDEDSTTASDTVDVIEQVDLSVVKAFASGQAIVGSSANTFTIEVGNAGPSTADNVVIADVVDPALTVVGVAVTPGGDCSGTIGNTIDCDIATLAPGVTATVTVTYDVPGSATGGMVSNMASVASDESATLMAVDSVELVEDVQLAVTKTFTSSPVTAGSSGNTFTIEVVNNGQSAADGVTITDTVAAVLTVDAVTISPSGDCSATVGNDLSCAVTQIRPGQTMVVTVTYSVPATANTSTVSNTASANSSEAPVPVSDTASVDVVEDVDLAVTKAFTAGTVTAGTGGHSFILSVTNTGLSSAESVNLTDTVDAALTVDSVSSAGADCSASSGQLVDCTVSSLAGGATATVTVGYTVDTSVPAGTVTNTVSATSAEVLTPVAATDTVIVDEQVDLTLDKSFGTATAVAGVSGYSFTLSTVNNGLSDAENVTITDTVDANLTVLSVTPAGNCSASSGQNVDCTFASLAAGATATVTVTYEVPSGATAPQTVANTAQVTSDEVTTPVVAGDSVDLTSVVTFDTEKSFAGSTVAAGSTGRSFTITVYNSGPSDAGGITVTDTVDARLTVSSVAISSGDCSASSGQTIDCSIPSLLVGQATVVTVYYDVAETVEPATIINTAQVDSTVPASSTTTSTTVDVVEDVDLVAAKTFTPDSAPAGSSANSFTITVTNIGLSTADNVAVTDVVDASLTVTAVSSASGDCSASTGNTVDCTIAALGSGDTATVTVGYDLAQTLDPTTITNTAQITSDEITTPVQPSADLTITEDVTLAIDKVFVDNPMTAGSTGTTFTIAVTNTGLSDGENVSITDTVDPGLAITAVTIDVGDCSASSGQLVDCTVASLAAGATATVTVTVNVDASAPAATVSNTATVESDEQAPTTDTATVGIVEDVDLSVTKTFSPNPAVAGTTGNSFTIVVTNNGLSNAENVVVTDTVAARIQVGSVLISPTGSCAAPSPTISCSAPSLAAGGSLAVTVGYSLDAGLAEGSVANTAAAISDEMTAPAYGTNDLQIDRNVQLDATKSFLADPVVAGSTGNGFAITVTNNGTSTSDPVTVTDLVDPEFTVTAVSSADGDCSASVGNTVDCVLDPLTPGSAGSVSVTFDVDEAATGTVTNTATIDSATLTSPLDATDSVTIFEDVSLTLAKTFGSATVTAGVDGYAFTLAVTNSGLSQADNLVITDTVAPALTVVTVDAPDGDCSATVGNAVDCSVAALASGATTTVTVTFDVGSAVGAGIVANSASVTSDEDTASGSDTVEVVTDSALTADKTFASPTVTAGSASSFSLTVANGGPSDATGVTVSDTVDSRLTVTSVTASVGDCSASTGQLIDCTIPTLASGQASVVTVAYQVASSVREGTVANTATVSAGATTFTPGDSVDIVEDVDLVATKTFLGSTVAGTTNNSFTIAVTNTGISDAADVVVTDTVDPRLAVTAVTVAPAGSCQAPAADVRCDVPTLAAGSTATVTVVFDLSDDATGTVTNTAEVTADGITSLTAADTLAAAVEADLSVTKTASPAVAGEAATFTITVANAGPSLADAVTVTETMPPELTEPVFSPDRGSYDPATGQWTGLGLAAGDTAELTVTADIPADYHQPVVNQVSVIPVDAVDPDPDNNDATAQTSTAVLSDLELVKTLDTANPVAGSPAQYTMVVTNHGPGAALDAPVVDEVAALMSDASWTCRATGSAPASCSQPSGNGDVEVAVTLMPGDTATVVVTGTLLPSLEGDLINSASVDGGAESDFTDNTSSVSVPVARQANLGLSKAARVDESGTSQAFSVGDTITYDLTVVNDGPSHAPDTVVTDSLPDGVEFVAATSERGRCSEADLVVTCAVGDLLVGESVVVSVQLRPTGAVAGTRLVNHATAASGAVDVETTGNAALAEVAIAARSPLAFTGAGTLRLLAVGFAMMIVGSGLLTPQVRGRST